MHRNISLLLICTFAIFVLSCKTTSTMEKEKAVGQLEKLDFTLDELDKDGLVGSNGSQVSVDYEFCYPKGADYEKQLHAIDSSLKFLSASNGRSGCSKMQSLAIGNTHKPNHKEILIQLSELSFVKKIRRVWYE